MKTPLYLAAIAFTALSAPAHATGGFLCKTAGEQPIVVQLGFGHVPSASLFLARLVDNGKEVPVTATQWWLRGSEMRLALVSKNALREELILSAQYNEKTYSYDGSIWRAGREHWVRCREN